ncbi:MAG: chain-length determining protein, partial [Muribaculaceae bacterium]|nr:chain-length determining protein [Muribaculaceae bacterium]
EATLAYNLYNSTSQQVQMAEVKVQESTPVFTVMQPAVVPFKAAKPRVMMIIVAFAFLGAFGALGYTLIVPPLVDTFKSKKAEQSKP